MPTRRYSILGHVQGVGFRAFVQRTAEAMEIDGEVWNDPDGTVYCIAANELEDTLEGFEWKLWRGPGRVDSVLVDVDDSSVPEKGFRIRSN